MAGSQHPREFVPGIGFTRLGPPRGSHLLEGKRGQGPSGRPEPAFQRRCIACRPLWATAFWGEPSAALASSARLVLGTVPDSTEQVPERGWTKDFAADRAAYLAAAQVPEERVESVATEHWRELRAAMPAIPLSGLVAVAMLERSSLATCEVHGMTLYAGDPGCNGRRSGDCSQGSLRA
ncbi:hypothetical protein SAMN05421755_101155 [Nitrosomonas sp. Nm33]|nr:hypothetical protein SAMN05421755_101155 [Nitrosomonas sp. Nm33]